MHISISTSGTALCVPGPPLSASRVPEPSWNPPGTLLEQSPPWNRPLTPPESSSATLLGTAPQVHLNPPEPYLRAAPDNSGAYLG